MTAAGPQCYVLHSGILFPACQTCNTYPDLNKIANLSLRQFRRTRAKYVCCCDPKRPRKSHKHVSVFGIEVLRRWWKRKFSSFDTLNFVSKIQSSKRQKVQRFSSPDILITTTAFPFTLHCCLCSRRSVETNGMRSNGKDRKRRNSLSSFRV